MNSGKVLLGVLAGVAVGALAGILLAPAKGSRTRRRILKKGEKFADGIKDKFNEYADDLSEKLEMAKDEVSAIAHKARLRLAETEKEIKTAKD
jgi:gas vesicle protein